MRYETQNIFFISDLHIGHKNVIQFDERPFHNTDEMHCEIIKCWNSVINDEDIVYYLGDLTFCGKSVTNQIIYSIRGKINFILGNHDKMKDIIKLNRWENVHEYGTEIFIKDGDLNTRNCNGYQQLILSHYPIFSWNRSHYGSFHLHGHSHGNLMKSNPEFYQRKILDVSCNIIDYTPISYTQVKNLMVKKTL